MPKFIFQFIIIAASWVSVLFASPQKGIEHYTSQQYAEAIAAFQSALQKNPSDSRLHYNLGNSHYQSQNYIDAIDSFQKALSTENPQLQQSTYYNLGNSFYRQGQISQTNSPETTTSSWKQALEAYENAIELNPEDTSAKSNRDFVQKQLDILEQQEKEKEESEQKNESSENEDQDDSSNQQESSDDSQQSENSTDSTENQNSENSSSSEKEKNETSENSPEEHSTENDTSEQNASDSSSSQQNQKQEDEESATSSQETESAQDPESDANHPTPVTEEQNNTGDHTSESEVPSFSFMSQEEAQQILEALEANEKKLPIFISPTNSPQDHSSHQKNW